MGNYTVSVIGPKNSFGALDGPYTPIGTQPFTLQGIAPARGESLQCLESDFYDIHPGQVHYFTAFAPNGNVVVICGSQSNNPLSNTAIDSQVAVLDPKTLRWHTVQIPTTGNKVGVRGSNGIAGGQDCADVGIFNNPGNSDPLDQDILVMTFGVYSGWDLAANGEFPIFALMSPATSGLQIDNQNGRIRTWSVDLSLNAGQIAASSPSKASGIYTSKSGLNGTYTDAHAPAEFAQFPQSHHIVFGHYFPWEGGSSGAFSVVAPTTTGQELRATYKMPNCIGPGLAGYNGGPYLWCAPREIECDPSSSLNDERFTVIYDTYPYAGIGTVTGKDAPHLLQEFSYNASTGVITPKSGFINVLQDSLQPTPTPGVGTRVIPGQNVHAKVGEVDGANQSVFNNYPPGDAKLFTLFVPQGATVTMTGTAVMTDVGPGGTILEMDWGSNGGDPRFSLGFWFFHNGTGTISHTVTNDSPSGDKTLCLWITGGGHADVNFTCAVVGGVGNPGPEIGTHRYDDNGNLYVTTNTIYSLQPNNPMAVFLKSGGERSYISQVPPLGGTGTAIAPVNGWNVRYNQDKARPDFYVPAVGRNSQVAYSHDVDTSRRNVLSIGLGGMLTVVHWDSGFPVGSNLLPSIDQLNASSGGAQPGALPYTGVSCTASWAAYNGKWSVQMVSAFANTMAAVSPHIGGLEVGRQYRVRADFAAIGGSTPVKCDVKIDCWDGSGNFIGVIQQIGTLTANDPSSGVVTIETNFDCLDRTATIQIELFVYTAAAGQTHIAQNVTLQSLPFKRTAVIDLGINVLRNTATPNPTLPIDQTASPIQVRKSCLDRTNNKLYTPVGFLGQQILGPTNAPPPTPHQIAQYLVCTDLNNLGAAVPGDELVQPTVQYEANMDTAYHSVSYPFSLPSGQAAPMCGFVVNIPIAGYPFQFGYSPPWSLGGGVLGGPAAVSTGEGQELVFVRGTNGQIYYRNSYGPTTNGWVSIGGGSASDPCAVVEPVPVLGTTGYNVHVFVVGNDGQVWQITRGPLGNWGNWTPRGGSVPIQYQDPSNAPNACRAPAAACLGTGKIDVYVCSFGNLVYKASLRSGVWSGFGSTGIFGDGWLGAWGQVASNTPTVYLTVRQSNGTTNLYGLPNGVFGLGASVVNLGGSTYGRSAVVSTQPVGEVLGSHQSIDVLTVGLAGGLWRQHWQSWVPPTYDGYTSTGWSGYQAVTGVGSLLPAAAATTGFHDQKDLNGREYLTWDAFGTNSGGSGAWGLSFIGQ